MMREGFPDFPNKNTPLPLAELLRLRGEIESVSFTPEEYHEIEEYIRSAKEEFRKFLESSLPDIRQRAVILKEQHQGSLPAIAVTEVEEHLLQSLKLHIEKQVQEEEYATFVILFDIYIGAHLTLDEIFKAEAVRRGKSDKIITSALSAWGELSLGRPMTSVEGVENYLSMKGKFQKEAQLLQDDPTGFTLIDDYAERLKRGDLEPPFGLNRTLMATGAEWAVEAYKEIYTYLSSNLE